MSQQLQLLQIAKHLSTLIGRPIRSSPAQPQLILIALKMLIPDAQQFFQQIQQLSDEQKQWNQIIGFIESQILEDGAQFGFQKLDTEEIIEIYRVIVQMVQEVVQGNQNGDGSQEEGQNQNEERSNNNSPQNNRQRSSGDTQSGSQMQNKKIVQMPPQKTKNKQSEDYITSLKRQKLQQKKRHEVKKPVQNKKNEKKDKPKNFSKKQSDQPKQNNKRSTSNIIKDEKPSRILPQSSLAKSKGHKKQQSQRPLSSMIDKQNKEKKRPKTAAVSKVKQSHHQNKKTQKNIKKSSQPNILNQPQSHTRTNRASSNLQNEVLNTVKQAMSQNKHHKSQQNQSQIVKSNPLMRNVQGVQMMKKAKRRFNYQVKSHTHDLKVAHKKKQPSKSGTNDKYLKQLKKKQSQMQQHVLNEQLKYYYQLRDKKIKYIKHMHTLVQRLQKQRQIDLNKQQSNQRIQQKQKINKRIQNADNLFENNIKQIKQQYNEQRIKNQINGSQQIKILKQMQKNINRNKENQLGVMKTLWQQEKMKLDLIAKDQQRMKSKLEEIYRKNRP